MTFLRKHPGVDPGKIPKSVWDDVRRGVSLEEAYARYEGELLRARNRELEKKLDAMRRNERNRLLSVGSMKSGGGRAVYDAFLAGFDEA